MIKQIKSNISITTRPIFYLSRKCTDYITCIFFKWLIISLMKYLKECFITLCQIEIKNTKNRIIYYTSIKFKNEISTYSLCYNILEIKYINLCNYVS